MRESKRIGSLKAGLVGVSGRVSPLKVTGLWGIGMRSRKYLLVIIIAIVLIAVIVGVGLYLRWREFRTVLPGMLTTELEEALDRPASVRSVRLTWPGTAVVRDLVIGDPESPLLTVPVAVVRFSLIDLLLGRVSVVESLTSLELRGPVLRLVRDREGRWNIEDLLRRPPVEVVERFAGRIVIRSGELVVIDYASGLPQDPQENRLVAVGGSLDFSVPGVTGISLRGRGARERIGPVELRGTWGDPDSRLTFVAMRASAPYWLNYFSDIEAWNLSRGLFGVQAEISRRPDGRLYLNGRAALRDAALTSPALTRPVIPMAANILFINDNLGLSARGYLGRTPVLLTGRVFGLAQPTLDLRLVSDRVDMGPTLSAIRTLPQVPGTRWPVPAQLRASITGPGADPVVAAAVRVPRATIYGVPVAGLEAEGGYRDGVIQVTRATARAAEGRVGLAATIRLQPFLASVRAIAEGVSLAQIPTGLPLSGRADAMLSLEYVERFREARVAAEITSGRVGDLRFGSGRLAARLTGPDTGELMVSVTNAAFRETDIRSAQAAILLRGRTLVVQRAVADLPVGQVAALGTATLDGALNLQVAADSVDLQQLLTPLGYEQVSGIADFQGTLTGTIDSPRLAGRLVARDGSIRGVEFDRMTATLIATENVLVLENVTLVRDEQIIVAEGRITIPREMPPVVALRIRAQQISLAELFAILNIPVPVEGIATADLQVRGTFPRLAVEGEIAVRNTVIAGIDFDAARVRLAFQEGQTVITELVAQRDGAVLVGSGFITPEGRLNIDIAGRGLTLALFNDILRPFVVLQGPLDFSGEIRGTLRAPVFAARILSRNPVVNQQSFEVLSGAAAWDGTTFALTDARLAGGGTEYTIPTLTFRPDTEALTVRAAVNAGNIARATNIFRNSPVLGLPRGETLRRLLATLPTPFAGVFNASLSLSGPLGNLTGGTVIIADGVQLGDLVVTRTEVDFITQRSVFLLNRLAVVTPDVRLAASAQFVEANPVSLSARIEETRLDALVGLLERAPILPAYDFGQRLLAFVEGIPRPVEGTVTASLALANLQTAPVGNLNLQVADLVMAGEPVGDLVVDARLAEDAWVLDAVALDLDPDGRLTVSGRITPDGEISITGEGVNVPLALAAPLVGTEVSGRIDFGLRAEGPLTSPRVAATFDAENVEVSGVTLDRVFADRVTIAGGRLASELVNVVVNESELVVSGSIPFIWEAPFIPGDQPVNLTARLVEGDFSIVEALNVVQEATGNLDASLTVTGAIDDPALNGEIALRDGAFGLRGLENGFTGVEFLGRFQDSVLTIETLSGASTLGGTFSGEGSVAIQDLTAPAQAVVALLLRLDALRLDIVEFADGGELVFNATGQLAVTETLGRPLVEGQLVVSDARIDLPAEFVPTALALPPLPVDPQFSVTLNLGRDVVVERGGLRAEVVGPVTVTGSVQQPVVAGTVRIQEGRLRFVGRTLTLTPGGIVSLLIRPPDAPVIAVEVEAHTRIIAASPITGRITRYTVVMEIRGPLAAPEIDVRSSPPGLTQERILLAIFGGAPLEALLRGQPLEEIFEEQLGQILLGFAVPGLFEGIELGLFVLAIEQWGFDVPLQFSVSAELTDRLLLRYSRSVVGATPFDAFALSYILSPQLAATVEFRGREAVPRETIYLVEYFTRF